MPTNRPHKVLGGFSLVELLVALAVGGIALSGCLYLFSRLLIQEREMLARHAAATQLEFALAFLRAELAESAIIYSWDCLQTGSGNGSKCAGLNFPANTVLAYWYRREISPFVVLPLNFGKLLDDCLPTAEPCHSPLHLTRTEWVLAAYSVCVAPNSNCPSPGYGNSPWLVRRETAQYAWQPYVNRLSGIDPQQTTSWSGWVPQWSSPQPFLPGLAPGRTPSPCSSGSPSITGTSWTGIRACVGPRRPSNGYSQSVLVEVQLDYKSLSSQIFVRNGANYDRMPL